MNEDYERPPPHDYEGLPISPELDPQVVKRPKEKWFLSKVMPIFSEKKSNKSRISKSTSSGDFSSSTESEQEFSSSKSSSLTLSSGSKSSGSKSSGSSGLSASSSEEEKVPEK